MQVHIRGKPNYDNLEIWEKSLLLDPLVEVIKDFYKNPTNRTAYEKWIADGKPMPTAQGSAKQVLMPNQIIKEVQYEQTKMSI